MIQVLEGVFESSHSNEMVATLKKIVTTTAVQNILTQKNLSRDIPLFIENYTRFLPVTCSHKEPITLKQGFLQSLGWVGKLLNTLFFTFTGSYNIDVDNPPKDQYRAQSQMMFLRAAISDALLIGGLITAAFITNIWVGVAVLAATVIALITLVIVYRILKSRCPQIIQDCTNLTLQASEGHILPSIGRESEIKQVIDALSSRGRGDGANVMLLGSPGVGKTQIAHELARRINEGSVPACLKNKKVFAINTAKLLSGEITFDQQASRIENPLTSIFNAVAGHENEVIFFIDEIHVAGQPPSAQGNQSVKLTELLKTELDSRNISCIVATTTKEYEETLKDNEAFIQRFTSITIAEPSPEELELILERYIQNEGEGVVATRATLNKVIEVANRLFPSAANPRKSKKVLKQLINRVRFWGPAEIDDQLQAQRLAREKLLAEGREKILQTRSELSQEIIESLGRLDTQINDLENAKRIQLLAIERIRAVTKVGLQNQSTLHSLSHALERADIQIEFVLRSLFLTKALHKQEASLKEQFQTEYNEPFIDTIDETLIARFADECSYTI